jgi:CheY-like chemotaxis protein/HPt (histidine-containing phosphotransfer) domain-containing protein
MEREHPMNPTDATLPRILLVEDDPVSMAFLTAAIEALPATVDRAESLAAARKLAAGHAHALWLIDANLPDGHGADLLAQLRHDFPDTPALAHTASQDRHALEALIDAGFLEVLVKPLPAKALQAAIDRALGPAPVMSMATGPKLPSWDDATALWALNGQQEHVQALRTLFLDELPAQRRSIASAAANGDLAAMRSTLHRLRASCGLVGAARLDAAVRTLESDLHCALALQHFDEAAGDLLPSA